MPVEAGVDCSKCGMEQLNDSQFCRYCGVAHSVAPTSGAAATAARAGIAVEKFKPRSETAAWIFVLFIVLIICWGIEKITLFYH